MTRAFKRGKRRRSGAAALAVGLTATAPAIIQAPPAAAHGVLNYCNPYQPIINTSYYFSSGWTAAERDRARLAFSSWDALRLNGGAAIYSSQEVPPSSSAVEMRRVASGTNNAPCNGALINIGNPTTSILRHEIGHNHGLNHSGPSHDIRTGQSPTLNGCGAGSAIRGDDLSSALYRLGWKNHSQRRSGESAKPWLDHPERLRVLPNQQRIRRQ